jgi:hypothetical protein
VALKEVVGRLWIMQASLTTLEPGLVRTESSRGLDSDGDVILYPRFQVLSPLCSSSGSSHAAEGLRF